MYPIIQYIIKKKMYIMQIEKIKQIFLQKMLNSIYKLFIQYFLYILVINLISRIQYFQINLFT